MQVVGIFTIHSFMFLYNKHTDDELFQLLKDGNDKAFNVIYDRYWKILFALAEKKLNDVSESEEVVQDIFIDLWNQRNKIELTHSLKSYLSGMVKFKIYAKLAIQYKRQKNALKLMDKMQFVEFSIEENLRLKELKLEILKAVNSLPDRCKLIYTLSRDEGMSHKQIAEILNISEKTIETQISRAIQRLRSAIQSLLFFFL